MRVTWRKQPHEPGLASIGEGPRGAILRVDGEDVGHVYARRLGMAFEWKDWYWTARGEGVDPRNSSAEGRYYDDIEAAKADCRAYIMERLSARHGRKDS